MEDLKDLSAHFAFGENWRSFLDTIDVRSVENARKGLERLFPDSALRGKRFLDIGCGSGLSMLAAASLGAEVHGIDIDPQSVSATRRLLGAHLDDARWSARELSVFNASTDVLGTFDVVYSWGVLHHTGSMWAAVERASSLVADEGILALALYRKTPLCGLWRWEKRYYSKAGPRLQRSVRSVYKAIFRAGLRLTGRDPSEYVASYAGDRGMSWDHDVHDWLGGYPYESVTPQEVSQRLGRLGFLPVRVNEKPARLQGLLGTHCDEFVFKRTLA